ncbi:hypothetical protein EJ02DRAFT_354584 [Clathrospora elynae]|uniref:Uncharacterized protein n=1 Tax=Clathrospora elynae TaxID=706981 RepID=A0A6A5SEZ5_9PLEO|nr:hypothetical protein EJ02DRAFT_354584 [Clathrospora elynae]
MQPNRTALSPMPDVVRAPSAPPHVSPPPPQTPEFLIIGLFALRLTKQLIEGLEYYPGRDADIVWLTNFLAPYHHEYALAKVAGARKDDYIAMYQGLVSRMKKQPRYPIRFMQINPDQSMQQARRGGEVPRPREMTDSERLDIVNFCDAAGEWGSIVPIPAREAERMIELADQRRIVDLDNRQPRVDGRQPLHEERHVRFDDRQALQDEGRPLQEDRQLRQENRNMLPEERRSPPDTRRPLPFRDDRKYFEVSDSAD